MQRRIPRSRDQEALGACVEDGSYAGFVSGKDCLFASGEVRSVNGVSTGPRILRDRAVTFSRPNPSPLCMLHARSPQNRRLARVLGARISEATFHLVRRYRRGRHTCPTKLRVAAKKWARIGWLKWRLPEGLRARIVLLGVR